jgi:hypothetical protein
MIWDLGFGIENGRNDQSEIRNRKSQIAKWHASCCNPSQTRDFSQIHRSRRLISYTKEIFMRKLILNVITFAFLAATFSTAYTTQAQVRAYRVSNQQVKSLLARIEVRTDDFRKDVARGLNRSSINGTSSEDSINSYVTDFENATDNLKRNFNDRRDVAADVQEVLNRAGFIQNFLRDYRLSPAATRSWNSLRTDLSTLASYYNVRWDWNNTYSQGNSQFSTMLTGTYRLNSSQSDNVNNIINSSLGNSNGRYNNSDYNNNNNNNNNQNDRVRRNLERRLTSPDMLVIDKRNSQVTIGSTLSPQVTFPADGVARTETNPNGRSVTVKATTLSSGVEVSYQGDRTNDFFVTFMPMNNGQLRVTRRLYIENRNQTVTVNSVYDKVSQTADFSMVNNNSNTGQYNPNYPNNTGTNDFLIPNGTQVVAVLTTQLSTSTANENDRFSMEVQSPAQYRGAIIEGYLSDTTRSGRVSGRAQATFNFETIRLRNGSTYRFTGLIDQVRQPNGDTVSVNNEGAVRDNNQTTRTVTRAGIGAGIGAILGAIIGGGQGAAIGAGVGAGAGAGTVILQGRDNLELRSGAEFRITSSAPSNLRANY